jgi:hypothetical protein
MIIRNSISSGNAAGVTATFLNRAITAFFFFTCVVVSSASWALGDPGYVTTEPKNGSFHLVDGAWAASLYVDISDYAGVKRAMADLQMDIERVTGETPAVVHEAPEKDSHLVIAGSIGKSILIDRLIATGKIDVSGIAGRWEAYHIENVANPLPGVERALVIAGSDKRGTIFGIYDLSEQIGVSPWYWWADVPVDRKSRLYIKEDTLRQDAPKVKYRGIFLNDEAPALTSWVIEKFGNYNHEFYEKVFELLLRLKANYLWPAMWNNAFNTDDPRNMVLADEYGIVMGTSHHEPMMRAHKEWTWTGEGAWDYATNGDYLYDFWKAGVQRNEPYESIITLGMRGDGDEPMSEGENIALLERVVADQRKIIADVYGKSLKEVPQVWTLYKEVQDYYDAGMRVPDDVTLLWADDNWGNIRRLPTPEERKRSGGAGVYYHFDYVGGPRSYRWINVTPIAKIWEQMNLAYTYNAREIWITNVGDLKPMEFPIEFFLRMAWDPADWPKERLEEFGELWAAREFGPEHAEDIEDLMTGYTRHNGRRKPELQSADTFSLLNYREADRIAAEMKSLVDKAELIYQQLPEAKKAAFYQLVLHPVKASATVTRMYIATGRNHLHASQGRATTGNYAAQARKLFQLDAELEQYFHRKLSNGKWNYLMAQPHIGYTHWNNPPADILPVLHIYEPHDAADMGVAVEGMVAAWPEVSSSSWPHDGSYKLPAFSPYGQRTRRLEIYNRGTRPFTFKAHPSESWIQLSQTEGQVEVVQPLEVSIDWNKAPTGHAAASIHVTGTGWGGATIQINTFKPDTKLSRNVRGFVEADGYVSIEASHYSDKKDVAGIAWEEIPLHGRTLSSISTFPVSDKRFEIPSKAPYVEYEIFFFTTGEFKVAGYFAPSWPITPGYGLRYGIGFDDEKPHIVDILAGHGNSEWEESVRTGVHVETSSHTITTPGLHKLRIYRIDPAVTLQKIVIDTGGLRPSYLGPPESPLM